MDKVGGGCAFYFVEIFRLVEITSLLHVIVMLEEKNQQFKDLFSCLRTASIIFNV